MYCPNCGKNRVKTNKVDAQEQYYNNNYWKQTTHKCTECLASFINFDDGSKDRKERERKELSDRQEYERLKEKYES